MCFRMPIVDAELYPNDGFIVVRNRGYYIFHANVRSWSPYLPWISCEIFGVERKGHKGKVGVIT